MANELQITALLSFTKAPAAAVSGGRATVQQINVAGTKYVHGVQEIGLAAETIDLGDIGTPGFAYIKNLDVTNYVELYNATDGAVFAKLKPGEPCLVRLGCAAPAAKANVAPCSIEYVIVED